MRAYVILDAKGLAGSSNGITVHPNGALNTGGVGRLKSAVFDQYLTISQKCVATYGHGYCGRPVGLGARIWYRMVLFPVTSKPPYCLHTFCVVFHIFLTVGDRYFKFGRLTIANPNPRMTNRT